VIFGYFIRNSVRDIWVKTFDRDDGVNNVNVIYLDDISDRRARDPIDGADWVSKKV